MSQVNYFYQENCPNIFVSSVENINQYLPSNNFEGSYLRTNMPLEQTHEFRAEHTNILIPAMVTTQEYPQTSQLLPHQTINSNFFHSLPSSEILQWQNNYVQNQLLPLNTTSCCNLQTHDQIYANSSEILPLHCIYCTMPQYLDHHFTPKRPRLEDINLGHESVQKETCVTKNVVKSRSSYDELVDSFVKQNLESLKKGTSTRKTIIESKVSLLKKKFITPRKIMSPNKKTLIKDNLISETKPKTTTMADSAEKSPSWASKYLQSISQNQQSSKNNNSSNNISKESKPATDSHITEEPVNNIEKYQANEEKTPPRSENNSEGKTNDMTNNTKENNILKDNTIKFETDSTLIVRRPKATVILKKSKIIKNSKTTVNVLNAKKKSQTQLIKRQINKETKKKNIIKTSNSLMRSVIKVPNKKMIYKEPETDKIHEDLRSKLDSKKRLQKHCQKITEGQNKHLNDSISKSKDMEKKVELESPVKKIKLVINIVPNNNQEKQSDSEESAPEKEVYDDLGFLDDLDINSLVECLNDCNDKLDNEVYQMNTDQDEQHIDGLEKDNMMKQYPEKDQNTCYDVNENFTKEKNIEEQLARIFSERSNLINPKHDLQENISPKYCMANNANAVYSSKEFYNIDGNCGNPSICSEVPQNITMKNQSSSETSSNIETIIAQILGEEVSKATPGPRHIGFIDLTIDEDDEDDKNNKNNEILMSEDAVKSKSLVLDLTIDEVDEDDKNNKNNEILMSEDAVKSKSLVFCEDISQHDNKLIPKSNRDKQEETVTNDNNIKSFTTVKKDNSDIICTERNSCREINNEEDETKSIIKTEKKEKMLTEDKRMKSLISVKTPSDIIPCTEEYSCNKTKKIKETQSIDNKQKKEGTTAQERHVKSLTSVKINNPDITHIKKVKKTEESQNKYSTEKITRTLQDTNSVKHGRSVTSNKIKNLNVIKTENEGKKIKTKQTILNETKREHTISHDKNMNFLTSVKSHNVDETFIKRKQVKKTEKTKYIFNKDNKEKNKPKTQTLVKKKYTFVKTQKPEIPGTKTKEVNKTHYIFAKENEDWSILQDENVKTFNLIKISNPEITFTARKKYKKTVQTQYIFNKEKKERRIQQDRNSVHDVKSLNSLKIHKLHETCEKTEEIQNIINKAKKGPTISQDVKIDKLDMTCTERNFSNESNKIKETQNIFKKEKKGGTNLQGTIKSVTSVKMSNSDITCTDRKKCKDIEGTEYIFNKKKTDRMVPLDNNLTQDQKCLYSIKIQKPNISCTKAKEVQYIFHKKEKERTISQDTKLVHGKKSLTSMKFHKTNITCTKRKEVEKKEEVIETRYKLNKNEETKQGTTPQDKNGKSLTSVKIRNPNKTCTGRNYGIELNQIKETQNVFNQDKRKRILHDNTMKSVTTVKISNPDITCTKSRDVIKTDKTRKIYSKVEKKETTAQEKGVKTSFKTRVPNLPSTNNNYSKEVEKSKETRSTANKPNKRENNFKNTKRTMSTLNDVTGHNATLFVEDKDKGLNYNEAPLKQNIPETKDETLISEVPIKKIKANNMQKNETVKTALDALHVTDKELDTSSRNKPKKEDMKTMLNTLHAIEKELDTSPRNMQKSENMKTMLNKLRAIDKELDASQSNTQTSENMKKMLNTLHAIDKELDTSPRNMQKSENMKTMLNTLQAVEKEIHTSPREMQKSENMKTMFNNLQAIDKELDTSPRYIKPATFKTCAERALQKELEQRMLSYLQEGYKIISKIHDGGFSTIYKCINSGKQLFVVKVLKTVNNRCKFGIMKEQMIMKYQNDIPKENLNCVYLLNSFGLSESRWVFLMEYYPKNVQQYLQEKTSIHIEVIRLLAQQLVSAAIMLRNYKIVHSDIRPNHVLINEAGNIIKLCGFDRSYLKEPAAMLPNIGTINYRAPEIIVGYSASFSIDVWSIAVVLFEMATGSKLFPGQYNNDILFKQLSLCGDMPTELITSGSFAKRHFRNAMFMRDVGPVGQLKVAIKHFIKDDKLGIMLHNSYARNWVSTRTVQQRIDDAQNLLMFQKLLEQMLVLHPKQRLAIEFVYASPFVFKQ